MATSFSVDTSNFPEDGYITISWTNGGAQPNHQSYRVYRRVATAGAWVLLKEDTGAGPNYVYYDYTAQAGISYQYAVCQVYLVGGIPTEEAKNPSTPTGALGSYYYWLVHPTDDSMNLRFKPKAESFRDEFDQAVFKLIGRGRKADLGTNYGKIGTLTIALRDEVGETAVEKRTKLDNLKIANTYLWLKNPFGDIDKVVLGDITYTRIPGGAVQDLVDATFEYIEVA